ncbi:MAG: TIGR04211 family SH3 domain-containing protein [Deltaproteobacteria bacterium]|nr:TIGR04211 family SH3 domain-containing protein [Deltaproteobacteria bacterium]
MTRRKQNIVAALAFCLTLFFTLWLPTNAQPATTLYVSDTTLEANLRSGTSQENRIIGMLRPGTKLTLTGEQDGWAEVTLEDGRTGWILKRYLSERPPWRETAEQLQKENEQLRTQLNKVRTEYQQIMQKSAEAQRQMDSQQAEFESVQREYDELKKSSTNYLNLKMAYENLQNEARQSKAKLDEVEKAYGKLRTSRAIRWFLSGAGVLMLGWIVGSSMARIRRRRSSDYYKL